MIDLAKKAKKSLRLGKAGGPPVYTRINDVEQFGLNKREKEVLNISYGTLVVAWLSKYCTLLQVLATKVWQYLASVSVLGLLVHFDLIQQCQKTCTTCGFLFSRSSLVPCSTTELEILYFNFNFL